ncbi:hypothetical protein DRQ33_05435 [bacterium]|nr:MAG: hypothetical protein DRQ33_05435 [bacterium]
MLILVAVPIWAGFYGTLWSALRYDSNICYLSEYDVNRFTEGTKEFLLTTYDDGILRGGVALKYYIRKDEFKLYFGLSIWGAHYSNNSVKDYVSGYAFAKIRRGGTNVKLSSGGTPNYHTRAYYDSDTYTTQWSSYKSFWGEGQLSQRIVPYFYGNFRYRKTVSIYNDFFPEYDSEQNEFELSLSLNGKTSLEAGYCFTINDARGYDMEGETIENSDESDISYQQDMVYAKLEREMRLWKRKFTPRIYVEFKQRLYTSTKPYHIDPLHIGRDDLYFSVEPSAKLDFTENLWTRFSINYRVRRAKSEFKEDIPKLRDYDRIIVEIILGKDF